MDKKSLILPKRNLVTRWILSSALLLTALVLIISWVWWFSNNRRLIEHLLTILSNNLITINFWTFSSIMFTLAGLSLLFALPLAFIKTKNTINNIFSLLSLILALAIFGTGLFFNLYLVNNPLVGDIFAFNQEHLVVLIPYDIIMVLSLIVSITSLINLVVVKKNVKIKEPKVATKDLIKPLKVNVNELNLKTNKRTISLDNSPTKTLATIKVTVPANGNNKDITDNIKVYQSKEDISLDLNIAD